MTITRFAASLVHRRRLTANSIELGLRPPAGFDFVPGQRIRISHGGTERDYSLASAPGDPELRLLVRVFPDGRLSPYLNTLSIDSEVSFYGPTGYFIFRASDRIPVFVATGTGVAPFVSMCRSGVGDFLCLHGARGGTDLLCRTALEKRASRYVPCLSKAYDVGAAFKGRVTDCLATLPADTHYDFYLCGHQEMVHDAFEIIDERFEGSHVYSEVFY